MAHVPDRADVWEKVVRKLRAGDMPPSGQPRPDKSTYDGFASWLETELDRAAAAKPTPGRTDPFHRLNRAEYHNAIRDLLALEIDVASDLPADDASYGFDNMAGVLRMSPTLMERYLVTASKISRRGDRRIRSCRPVPTRSASQRTFRKTIAWTVCRSARAAARSSAIAFRRTASTPSASR